MVLRYAGLTLPMTRCGKSVSLIEIGMRDLSQDLHQVPRYDVKEAGVTIRSRRGVIVLGRVDFEVPQRVKTKTMQT